MFLFYPKVTISVMTFVFNLLLIIINNYKRNQSV